MTEFMHDVKSTRVMPFDEAVSRGLIRPMPPQIHQSYLSLNLALASESLPPRVKAVYSPLCGTGDGTVGTYCAARVSTSRSSGRKRISRDVCLDTIPLAKSGVPEAARPALIRAKEKDADLVLCTDPDADRLGAYAKSSDGSWRYLNGNEIGAILAYYLVADRVRGPRRSGLLIKTLVTTQMLESIRGKGRVRHRPRSAGGLQVHRQRPVEPGAGRTVRKGGGVAWGPGPGCGREPRFLLTPEIRDKDAAGAALILCELLSKLRAEGKFLPDYLDALTAECGDCKSVARSIVMRGIKGAELLAAMMGFSSREAPAELRDSRSWSASICSTNAAAPAERDRPPGAQLPRIPAELPPRSWFALPAPSRKPKSTWI